MRHITPFCLSLIKQFEGFSAHPYLDENDGYTIGYGHLIKPGEVIKAPLSDEGGEALLKKDVTWAEKAITRYTKVSLNNGQFDALVSFIFNIGTVAFKASTLLKRVNSEEHKSVPYELRRWVYDDGNKLRGLIIRRELEAKMYKGEYNVS